MPGSRRSSAQREPHAIMWPGCRNLEFGSADLPSMTRIERHCRGSRVAPEHFCISRPSFFDTAGKQCTAATLPPDFRQRRHAPQLPRIRNLRSLGETSFVNTCDTNETFRNKCSVMACVRMIIAGKNRSLAGQSCPEDWQTQKKRLLGGNRLHLDAANRSAFCVRNFIQGVFLSWSASQA